MKDQQEQRANNLSEKGPMTSLQCQNGVIVIHEQTRYLEIHTERTFLPSVPNFLGLKDAVRIHGPGFEACGSDGLCEMSRKDISAS